MAQLTQEFDANKFDPTQSVGGLPIGRHRVVIESSEVKANKANDGGYLQLDLKIIDGPDVGTIGAYRLNLYHSNQQTVEIAHKQLSAICHCVNVFRVKNSAQLHNIQFMVEVGPQKNNAQYTEVKKVFDANGNEPVKAVQCTPPNQDQIQQQPDNVENSQNSQKGDAWEDQYQAEQQPQNGGAPWAQNSGAPWDQK